MDGVTSTQSDAGIIGIVGIGAGGALVLLVVSLLNGRRKPTRLWPWITALVIQAIPAAFLTVPAVMTLVQGFALWMTVGILGLWLLIGVTVIRPQWAAWALAGSAAVMPVLVWVGSQWVDAIPGLPIEPLMVLGFYSLRSTIAAGLLWWAGQS